VTVLADTSIWVDFFRGNEPEAAELEHLLGQDELVTCGPILAELLAGANHAQRATLWLALGALPAVELDVAAWREAGEIASDLRSLGETTPLLDVLIGIAAVRGGAALWTRDADFERLQKVIPGLALYRVE
jgi:predicted nucleic acid-binding protein